MNDCYIPDSLVALGKYTPEILNAIKTRSGKFAIPEIISKNPELVEKLKKLGVIVGGTNPTILLAHENPDDNFFKSLQESVSHFPDELLRYTKANGYHIRGGSPGDMKGLVDAINTLTIQDTSPRNSINQAIQKIRTGAINQTADIGYYAENEGVYWDPKNIQIGVVPTFDLPIVTVTEDPNRDDRLFIDTIHDDGKRSHNRIIRRVEYTGIAGVKPVVQKVEVDLNDTSIGAQLIRAMSDLDDLILKGEKTKNTFDEINSSPEGKNIASAIALLKDEKILDPNMTYQFEFGWIEHPTSKLILLQVREFAKKNPINTDTLIGGRELSQKLYASSVTRIITGLKEGEEHIVPIVAGQSRLDIWKSVKNGDYNDGFAARPEYNRDDLRSWDYNPNMRIFFHGDAHEGTLAHNSFRFAQSLVRKGGTIILGLENSFINNAPAEIGMRIRNGLLELMESRYAESSSTPAGAKKKPIALKQPK